MLTCVLNGLCMTLLQKSYMSSDVDCMCILPHYSSWIMSGISHCWYVYTCILVFNDRLIIGKKNCLENESLSKFTLEHTAQLLDYFAALLIITGRYRYMNLEQLLLNSPFVRCTIPRVCKGPMKQMVLVTAQSHTHFITRLSLQLLTLSNTAVQNFLPGLKAGECVMCEQHVHTYMP